MSANFRMSCKKNGTDMHITLAGDFDGSSAHELSNVVEKGRTGGKRIFIHTDRLRDICHFGAGTFQALARRSNFKRGDVFFVGKNATNLAPAGARILEKAAAR